MLRSLRFALAAGAALATATAGAQFAEPADPLAQWLAERGVLDPLDPLVQLLAERGLLASAGAGPSVHAGRQAPGSDTVLTALNFLDIPYVWGGVDARNGFDCSGFTRHVYRTSLGLALPRSADEQASAPGFAWVDRGELRPGDLVFFNTLGRTYSHVGIYLGGDRFVHAPSSGRTVRVESMNKPYWFDRYSGARRVAAALLAAMPR